MNVFHCSHVVLTIDISQLVLADECSKAKGSNSECSFSSEGY